MKCLLETKAAIILGSEVWLRQDVSKLLFRKVCDGGASVSSQGNGEDFLTLKHMGRFFGLNVSEESMQGSKPMISCTRRRLSLPLQVVQECFHQ
jgi:hypothetical protein